jgi:predicted flap endonuclease-1-like 5' DNA nuclease
VKATAAPKAEAKPAAQLGPGRPKSQVTEAGAKPPVKRGPGRPKGTATKATAKPAAKRGPGRPKGKATKAAAKPAAKRGPGRPKGTATKAAARRGRPAKPKAPASPLQAIEGFGPALARNFEAAGVNTPAKVAALSNVKMAEILAKCGPRYRNATPEKMDAYRKAAKAAK